jgi:hypothetical protein
MINDNCRKHNKEMREKGRKVFFRKKLIELLEKITI